MVTVSLRDWLAEQEHRKGPVVYLLEWLAVFAAAMLFWTVLILEIRASAWSLAMAAAISSIYASATVYLRLMRSTACRKCHSWLAVTGETLSRRHVRDVERVLEIERGGEEWYGHYLDIYSRQVRIEIVKYRCRRCRAVWEETTLVPDSDYELIRTIDVKD